VILRLRHVMDGPDNSTLKLRRAVADRLTGPWRAGSVHEADYRLEYDWGLRRVLAASLERRVNSDQIEDIVAGRRPCATRSPASRKHCWARVGRASPTRSMTSTSPAPSQPCSGAISR
jgi:hypothetical protein